VAEYGIVTLLNADRLSEWVFYLAIAHWIKKAIKFNQQLTNRLGSNGYGYWINEKETTIINRKNQ
jgi:hypothetical protein